MSADYPAGALSSDEAEVDAARGQLLGLLFGFSATQVLHAIIQLGVTDLLADSPATAGELAGRCEADPAALYRLLRAASMVELVTLDGQGRFQLTERGRLLRAAHPRSVRNLVLLFASEEVWRSWGELTFSVRTGATAFARLFGQDSFEYFASHPRLEAIFNEAMAEYTREVGPRVVAACELAGRRRVADLGGGNGALLADVLTAHPTTAGVLFDTASGLRDAEHVLGEAGVRNRCEIIAGDFFDSIPGDCDAYLLKSVIHDWDDERATAILRRCREAMPPGAVLYLAEPVVPADPDALRTNGGMLISDLNMLVSTGGRERTEAEFAAILTHAGLSLRRVTRCGPPGNGLCVLRAEPTDA